MKRFFAWGALTLCLLTFLSTPVVAADDWQVTELNPTYVTQPTNVALTVDSTTGASVVVKLSREPLTGRSQIQAALNNNLELPSQSVVRTTLSVGSSILTIPSNYLSSKKSGVYLIDITGGTTRKQMLLPIQRGQLDHPLQVVTLLPLTAAPSKVGADNFVNDDSLAQWHLDGNLAALLSAASSHPKTTWLLDPDLVDTASALADGGTVLKPEPHEVSETVSEGAKVILNSLPAATAGHEVYLLPFAGADINGLVERGQGALAKTAMGQTSQTRELLGRADLARAVVAARGDFTDSTWQWLNDQSVYLPLVTSNRWTPNTTTMTPTSVITTPADSRALVIDKTASRQLTLAMLNSPERLVHEQAFAAELLITALEVPEDRTLVLMPRMATTGMSAQTVDSTLGVLDRPWVKAVTPTEAMANGTTTDRVRTDDASRPVFGYQYTTAIRALDTQRRALSGLIHGTAHDERLMRGQIRLASALFTSTDQRSRLLNLNTAEVADLKQRVRVVSSGSVVFTSESGVVPITILNDLEVDATVKLTATGVPGVRVIPTQVDLITISPGKRKSIEVPTRLIGSDTAFLNLQLYATDGKKIGEVVQIQLSSTAYSKAAAWLVGIAFVLLLTLIAVNTVRRIRVHRKAVREAAK